MKGESMNISAQALDALVRIVVGCMPPIGKEKRRFNEAHIVSCAAKKQDISFDEFKKGLADGSEMYDAICKYAEKLDRSVIDLDVVSHYFAGDEHILKTKKELAEMGVDENSYFFSHMLFTHTLVPAEIIDVFENGIFSAIYRASNGCEVHIKNVRTFLADRNMLKKGKIVLVHFPLLVAYDPDVRLVKKIISKQSANLDFMRSCALLGDDGLDHNKIKMHIDWINDSIERYGL